MGFQDAQLVGRLTQENVRSARSAVSAESETHFPLVIAPFLSPNNVNKTDCGIILHHHREICHKEGYKATFRYT